MTELFTQCRANFGLAPRKIGWRDRNYLLPPAPNWLGQDAQLKRILRDRKKMMVEGKIVAGAVVQANGWLYQPGEEDLPALVLWSDAAIFETEPEKLLEMARAVFALKHTTPDGDEAEIAGLVTNESSSPQNVRLSASLSGENEVFLTSILFWRRHFPFGFLTGRLLPLVVMPEVSPFALLLPARFWPDALKDQ